MKLVRDGIPGIIESAGKDCTWRYCNGHDEHMVFLGLKMTEEVQEFLQDPSLEEAADMYEVFLTFLKNWGIELSDVRKFAQYKSRERGKFDGGIVLDDIIEKNNS